MIIKGLIIIIIYNTKQDTNKLASREYFDKYFTTDDKNYYIKTKKSILLNLIKKSQTFLYSFVYIMEKI